jgi:NAD(P) transhydrogenase
MDHETVDEMIHDLRTHDLVLRCNENVTSIAVTPEPHRRVQVELESGKRITADAAIVSGGRQGCVEGLHLEAIGLAADARGRIGVDGFYRTSVASVFAAGDIIGFPALSATSAAQGRIAALAMFGAPVQPMGEDYPFGIYAIPEISMVGWTEERLTAEGVPYESGIAHYKEIARGQLLGDELGMLKLLIHQDSHVILGVHIIGTGATELVHIGQGAIAFKATVEHFVNTVFNYPTLAECYKVAAFNALNKLRAV